MMRLFGAVATAMGALCALSAPAAAQPSFDCAKAGAAVEKAICSDERLSALDAALADLYRATMKAMGPGPNADAFRNEQRAWIAGRDKRCPVAPAEAKAPSDKTMVCLVESYLGRHKQIHDGASAEAAQAPEAPWIGKRRYRVQGFDGDLVITPAAGGALKVAISTVNILRMHSCELEFEAKPQGGELRWTDPEVGFQGQRCQVTLRRLGALVKLDAKNCQDNCGMAGVFDGAYAP